MTDTDFTINFPFSKIDKVKRTVTGIATADNFDTDRDIMEIGASVDAFQNWIGNIREMHQPKAVGKMLNFNAPVPVEYKGKMYNGLEVTVYVSKGAEDTWQKVLDGTLKGFSIGGGVIEKSMEYDRASDCVARRVSKYMLTELSLVDNPANPAALITMFKSVHNDETNEDELIYKAQDAPVKMNRVFYCEKDQIATADVDTCSKCSNKMVDIGFVEEFDSKIIKSLINDFEIQKIGGVMKLQENTEDGIVGNMDEELTDVQKDFIAKRLVKSLFGKNETAEANPSVVPPVNINVNIDQGLLKSAGSEESNTVEDAESETVEEGEVGGVVTSDDVTKSAKEETVAEETAVEEAGNDDIVKALSGVINDALTSFKEEITKTVDEKIEAVTKSVDEKVEKFADDGAVQKSADTEVVEEEVIEKSASAENDDSFWGGRFVPAPVAQALGYRS